MEKPPKPPNSLETFGLTLEELKIAEREFANLDENVQIILCFVSVYSKGEYTLISNDFMKNLLIEEFELTIELSKLNLEDIFENSFFGEINPEKNTRIKPKYYDFVVQKRKELPE